MPEQPEESSLTSSAAREPSPDVSSHSSPPLLSPFSLSLPLSYLTRRVPVKCVRHVNFFLLAASLFSSLFYSCSLSIPVRLSPFDISSLLLSCFLPSLCSLHYLQPPPRRTDEARFNAAFGSPTSESFDFIPPPPRKDSRCSFHFTKFHRYCIVSQALLVLIHNQSKTYCSVIY